MNERREYFDSCAHDWDKNFTARDMEILSDLIGSFRIKSGDKVADIGCGTGVLFDILRHKVGPEGIIIGVDFASAMIRKARSNSPFNNCVPLCADVENLPLKSDSFDLVVSLASFPHFVDKRKVMTEVSRVLKRGAGFHIIHLLSSEELAHHHHHAGGPVAMDLLPPQEQLMQMFEEGHFLNAHITDRPGLYLASAVKG
jgi:ubiquinone/menaquinone biosynthesis C-methylase UbiE